MTTKVIGHAATIIGHEAFTSYAMDMGREFRGFATIEASTTIADGKIKGGKGSGFSGRIAKFSKCQVVLNPRLEGYEDAVNRQRAREVADGQVPEYFEAKPRSWGEHVKDTTFVTHKGETYLEVRVLRSLETTYTIDGQPVPRDVAEALLHPLKGSGRQGVENAVILRDYNVKNISRVKWTSPDGVEYDLTIE